MCGCLFLFKSLTHAQRAAKQLEKYGINSAISRPPREINESSCGYSINIRSNHMSKALEILKQSEILKFKVYICMPDGTYKEHGVSHP